MSPRILLIDDDQDVRRAFKAILERAGMEMVEAEDGAAGIALFERGRFDLVIVDVIMPRMTGIEVIQILRNIAPDVPIIAMSGGGRMADMRFLQVAGQMGAIIELTKPVRSNELLDALRRGLKQ
jgi:CheY-like chemotaxis protein